MQGGAAIPLSLALAFGAFVSPHLARAVDAHTNTANQEHLSAQQEASRMVAAPVDLKRELDARKIHAGDHFEAVLQRDVQLKNGPRLTTGTVLLGTVTADQLHSGHSRLAIRFTRARLKTGQTVPVMANVVYLTSSRWGSGINVADESDLWSPNTLHIDEIGAISGIDLHSAIGARNSAVLISKKDDVKVGAGSQMVVAIAARNRRKGMANNS